MEIGRKATVPMPVEVGGSIPIDLIAGQRTATICAFRIALDYWQATIVPAISDGRLESTGSHRLAQSVNAHRLYLLYLGFQ